MELPSFAWIRAGLYLSPLLVSFLTTGCVNHVFIGGEGGGGASADGGSAGATSATSESTTPTGGNTGVDSCSCQATLCDGEWVDITANPRHCGGCGADCGPGMGCMESACASLQGDCVSCAALITDGAVAGTPLCESLSQSFYDDLVDCACGSPCGSVCGDNLCSCGAATEACLDCVLADSGCATPFNECANDI